MTIKEFNADNLAFALSNDFTTPEVIKSKNQFDYFLAYLGNQGLHAKSIVIEQDYISKDYLYDYAAYYALCFTKYEKVCRRIHFFNTSITEELLQRAILEEGEISPDFWDSYLGFIVRKPIPGTVIGYSILKHYYFSKPDPYKEFWGLRKYEVHFFGKKLEIESLAFQEQDSVLAACATTAIWSMLNKASNNSHTILKSPNEITRDAGNVSPDGDRLFPNKGLSVLQICQAINNSGLVCELKKDDHLISESNSEDEVPDDMIYVVSNEFLRKIINAYAPLGIPIILVVRVPSSDSHGSHAITVSGFRKTPPAKVQPSLEMKCLSDNIDRIYAHDDQWGPFARIDLQNDYDLKTPWTDNDDKSRPTRVSMIIVPVFPKVRISYEDIEYIVRGIDTWLTLFFQHKIGDDLVWDIKIDYSENFKNEIRKSSLDSSKKMVHLVKSLPKYIWIANCYIGSFKALQITFDATNVNNGMIGIDVISYMPDLETKKFQEFLRNNALDIKINTRNQSRLLYYEFLLKGLGS